MYLLRLALATYRWPRRLRDLALMSCELFPSRGVIAGASGAVYELKVFLLGVIIEYHGLFSARVPPIVLVVHIDDFVQTLVGRTLEGVV